MNFAFINIEYKNMRVLRIGMAYYGKKDYYWC